MKRRPELRLIAVRSVMTMSGINVVRAWQVGSTHGFYIHAAKMGQWTPPDLAHVVFEEAVIRHQRERHG